MTELYLILHKVRGEPTFDIACRLEEDEDCWIIPTSGHRAYPYRRWAMSDIYDGSDYDAPKPEYVMDNVDPPEDLPDHYQVNASPKESKANGDSLLASLGLPTKVHSAVSGKLTRRI